MIIRRATIQDVAEITGGFREFCAELLPDNPIAPEPDGFFFMIGNRIANDSGFGCFVARDHDGTLLGACAAQVGGIAHSPSSRVAHELILYVRPVIRGTLKAGKVMTAMIRQLELWAIEQGCSGIVMFAVHCKSTALPKAYMRRGFKLLEMSFLKGL